MERVRLPLPPHTKSLNRIILNASHSYRKPVNLIFPAFDTGRYMVDGELEKYKIDQKQRYLKSMIPFRSTGFSTVMHVRI